MQDFRNHILVTYDTDKNKAFKDTIFKRLITNHYKFEYLKRIKENTLKDFTKIFVYNDNTIMPVTPTSSLPYGYYERIKSNYTYYVDTNSKIILLLEK